MSDVEASDTIGDVKTKIELALGGPTPPSSGERGEGEERGFGPAQLAPGGLGSNA